MKKILLTTFFVYSICIPAQNNQELIDELYDEWWLVANSAVQVIIEIDLEEAFPHLDSLYNSKPPIVQRTFLMALLQFEDPNIENRLRDYISRADDFINEEYPLDPLTEKVFATLLIFSIGEYDTYEYIFDIIDRDGLPNISVVTFTSLTEIITHVPEAESQAKNDLLEIWNNGSEAYRALAMGTLTNEYGIEMLPGIINTFTNDEEMSIRSMAFSYLSELQYPLLEDLLKMRLSIEPSWSFRTDIADTLLLKFGTPSALKTVMDYQPAEPNETSSSLMNFAINDFIPPEPDSSVASVQMTEDLRDITDEIYSYNWILTQDLYDKYIRNLDGIIIFIQNGRIADAISELNTILDLTEVKKDTELTVEGYKFMHYHTAYILDMLTVN